MFAQNFLTLPLEDQQEELKLLRYLQLLLRYLKERIPLMLPGCFVVTLRDYPQGNMQFDC